MADFTDPPQPYRVIYVLTLDLEGDAPSLSDVIVLDAVAWRGGLIAAHRAMDRTVYNPPLRPLTPQRLYLQAVEACIPDKTGTTILGEETKVRRCIRHVHPTEGEPVSPRGCTELVVEGRTSNAWRLWMVGELVFEIYPQNSTLGAMDRVHAAASAADFALELPWVCRTRGQFIEECLPPGATRPDDPPSTLEVDWETLVQVMRPKILRGEVHKPLEVPA